MDSEPLSQSLDCLSTSVNPNDVKSSFFPLPSATNSLNRRKVKSKFNSQRYRKSWSPAEKDAGNLDLWDSNLKPQELMDTEQMQSNSDQIMDDKYQTNSLGEFELSWDPTDVSPTYEWSYSEFLDQYNELYEWLIQVQLRLYENSNPPDKASRITQQQELNRQAFRRKLFVEQGENAAVRFPNNSEEISWRVNYLNNKWEQLHSTLKPKKGQTYELEVEIDLAHEEQILCNWLSTMEGQIQPITCRLAKGSSVQTLQERYKDNQILLKDIEAHGPILKSVIRQHERAARKNANPSANLAASSPPPLDGAKPAPVKVPRRARALEKRWHQIYLRSLEWHYYLEGAIEHYKNPSCSSQSSESEDEPLTKCRRLCHDSPTPSRRRTNGWSQDELNPSETGSYIEDDYVHVTGAATPRDQRKRVRREKLEGDCVVPLEIDQSEIVLEIDTNPKMNDQSTGSPNNGSPQKVNLTSVVRTSANCGVYDYRHLDTDPEEKTGLSSQEVSPMICRRRIMKSPSKRSPYHDHMKDDEVDHEALQEIIDGAILDQNWLDSALTSESESMASLPKDDHVVPLAEMSSSMASSRESLHQLISNVDTLVQQPLLTSPRQALQPLAFGLKEASKQRRIRQWLSTQSVESGDASGEQTEGSDAESEASCRRRSSADLLGGSSENTPTVEVLPCLQGDLMAKVVRRGKKRNQSEQRPWSMSELQLLAKEDLKNLADEGKVNLMKGNTMSTSESALNGTLAGSSDQLTQELTSPSPEDNDRTITLLTPGGSASASENLSSDSPAGVLTSKRASPLLSSDSYRKRRPKFRRRSLKLIGRKSDSGSDEAPKFYSTHLHSLTNDLSSEQEDAAKSSETPSKGQTAVTSSTEQYLSDSSLVLGVPKIESLTAISSPRTNSGPFSPRSCEPFTPRTNPSDNDAANSSLSEQAWDPYQEHKYLSEPYSEDFDHDAARRLLNFGDDYSKYIESDDSSLLFPVGRLKTRKSPKRIRRSRDLQDSDEESDLEDLLKVLDESQSQLETLEAALEKASRQANYNELHATSKTNLKVLREILKHLQSKPSDFNFELSRVQGILQRWESMESKLLERQRQSTHLHQLQRQVLHLKSSLERINHSCSLLAHPHSLAIPSELNNKAEQAKNLLEETEGLKGELSALNVLVHRFTVDVGSAPLKDEVADLYRLFDETKRRVSGEVSRFESAEATWRLWEEQRSQLMDALKQDSETLKVLDEAITSGRVTDSLTASVQDVAKLLNDRRKPCSNPPPPGIQLLVGLDDGQSRSSTSCSDSKDGHCSDSGTSGYESCSSDDLSERERRLAYLRRLARDLEANLVPGSNAWNEISKTLSQAEQELQGLQSQCRNLVRKTAETFDQGVIKSAITPSSSRVRPLSRERKSKEKKNRSWMNRVVRAALPFQIALLLVLVVACLLEPNCCDSLNTLNLSLSPQLRFVHGDTPV